MRCLFGSLRACISHDTFFFLNAPSGALRGLAAFPAGEMLSCSCALCSTSCCLCVSCELLACFGCSLCRAALTGLLNCSSSLWEVTFCILYVMSCGMLEVWTYSQLFLTCSFVTLLERADLGVCHFPGVISKEKLFPCSPFHSQRLLLPSQWGLSCLEATWWAPQHLLLPRCLWLFWNSWWLGTMVSLRGFENLLILILLCFSFLKDCVILWCFLPASASHPFYPRLPDSLRNLLVLTCSDATALLKWRFASAGPIPALCISCFLRRAIALNKEGRMQSLFCKA